MRPLNEQNLELAMCITLSAACGKNTLSKKEVLQMTGYYDWFARIPDIVAHLQERREEELIFDTDYNTRSRLYLYPIRNLDDKKKFPNSDYYLWPTHMNHGIDTVSRKCKIISLFKTIEERLFLEKFPIYLTEYKTMLPSK